MAGKNYEDGHYEQDDDDCWEPALADVRYFDPSGAKAPDPTPDNVNNPPHYNQGSIECIDAIQSALSHEEFRGYCKGNALKYIWREKMKGGNESLEKAVWYLNRALASAK